VAHTVAGLPKNECAHGVALNDAVEKLRCLRLVPYEIALEHRQLGAAGINVRKQDRVFFGMVLGLLVGHRSKVGRLAVARVICKLRGVSYRNCTPTMERKYCCKHIGRDWY